jgi:hypothetical protein
MNEVKRTRRKLPEHMRGVTTSLRLRPDRLAKYKEVGGVKWLNMLLDDEIELDKMWEDMTA